MGIKQVMSFIKIEHTLFSLPFILIGYFVAVNQFYPQTKMPIFDLLWVLFAAIGARGLAMTLNRIIDRNIDRQNPRTASRHLASQTMSLNTAWALALVFLLMLVFGAGMLNRVALMMSWLPVAAFVIYPYTKRFTWFCHLWLGFCLGLAPAGAWLAIAADFHGWSAITGIDGLFSGLLWYPSIFYISTAVMLWITVFDINYARMDVDNDRKYGIKSFPARFSSEATTMTCLVLTLSWFACFIMADPLNGRLFDICAFIMTMITCYVILKNETMQNFQDILFKISVSTGWVLLIPFLFTV